VSRVFFTADTHLGHANIIKYCNRPYLTDRDREALESFGGVWPRERTDYRITREAVDMMDTALIDNINDIVGYDDTLWIEGDFAFPGKHDTHNVCKRYRDRIVCRNVNLILGNHDKVGTNCPVSLFQEVTLQKTIYVGSQKIVLNHCAAAIWFDSHKKNPAWMLYGHSHGTAEKWLDKVMPGRRSMDVGVDNAAKILGEYRPFSFEEVSQILSKRTGTVIDHHGAED
jgi:calcineurin-like phosphoesterase family protein